MSEPGYLVLAGPLPAGVLPGWMVNRTAADLVDGDGWVVTGPWTELARWPPASSARLSGRGTPDPAELHQAGAEIVFGLQLAPLSDPDPPHSGETMSTDPATVDIHREERLDRYLSEHEEALVMLARWPWLSADEREKFLLELAAAGFQLVVVPAAVAAIQEAIEKVKDIVARITERDPERMRRHAARLQRRGKAAQAAELLAEAKALEARRGNVQ